MAETDFNLDLTRHERIGLDEAVLAGAKTPAQLGAILDRAHSIGIGLLVTRLDPGKFAALSETHKARLDYDPLSRTGVFLRPHQLRSGPPVAIVSAGTGDLPAAREAARTLEYYGQPYLEYADVGVAGLWRLLERIDEIKLAPAVIAVAGMDAALISVVGGLVPGSVIGVPTSVGYGVAAEGMAALHAALTSCAPGVVVVNIDNGYGAACAALRVTNALGGQSTQSAPRKSALTAP
jgi:hypothetical protein